MITTLKWRKGLAEYRTTTALRQPVGRNGLHPLQVTTTVWTVYRHTGGAWAIGIVSSFDKHILMTYRPSFREAKREVGRLAGQLGHIATKPL